jgi:hypothetical protein
MRVNARKKLMRRAVFAACLLDVYDFTLDIIEDDGDETYTIMDGPKQFRIHISKDIPGFELMGFIGHEVVHVAQYMRGDLADSDEGTIWKGELYPDPEYLSDEYFLAPWEMEARALQAWITHKWETRVELH